MTRQEFERRFRARIVERLTPEWSERAARRAADCEWDAYSDWDATLGDDPEGAADESMTYWADGV